MDELLSEKRRARCQRCRHERYMHEYEKGIDTLVLGPCKSEPRAGVAALIAGMCGCTHTRFDFVPASLI